MVSAIRFLVLVTICVHASVRFTAAQVQLEGPCPNVPVVPKFNISRYMGLWYEVAKYPAVFETDGKCITATYELLENETVSVLNSQYNTKVNAQIEIEGNAEVVENAKLLVQFSGQPTPTESSNYWIIGTDYINYSVVFSCSSSSSDSHSQLVWVLTRERVPSMDTQINALVVLTSNKLALNYLTVTDQNECE